MSLREDRRWFLGLTFAVLLVAVFPYAVLWLKAGKHFVFSGLVYLPYDGYAYLAKMREGWLGAWRFTLAYTPHPGQGAYLYLFHLALGHLARFWGLSLPLTYNLARLAGDVAVVWALGRFFGALFPRDAFARRFAWAASLFGLGMGWAVLPWAQTVLPMDFWVSEVYPLLTVLTNAHFPWALALLLALVRPAAPRWWNALAAFGLALLSPFGVVLVNFLLALQFGVEYTFPKTAEHNRSSQSATRNSFCPRLPFPPAASEALCRGLLVALGGVPYAAYAYWATHRDPVLAGWTAQNRTPLLPWWNMLFALLPWALLALAAWQKPHPARRPLALWVAAALLLAALPTALPRRFLMGLFVPLVGLTALAWREAFRRHLWGKLVPLMAAPSVVLVVAAPAVLYQPATPQGRVSLLYLTRGEAEAMAWLREHTPPQAVVLAAPDTGAIIPAWSGRRVLYGHPMETLDGPRYRELVGDFFRRCLKGNAAWAFLRSEGVDYIFVGPRERELGGLPIYLPPETVVARFEGVTIYKVAGATATLTNIREHK